MVDSPSSRGLAGSTDAWLNLWQTAGGVFLPETKMERPNEGQVGVMIRAVD